MYYGIIVQEDIRNKAQTLFGILTSAVFQILVVTHYESKDYYLRKIEQKLKPPRRTRFEFRVLRHIFDPLSILA